MKSRLVGHLVFPLHEWVLGRDTRRMVRELEDSQWWSPDDLRELQREKLRALLIHAWRNVPHYTQKLREIGIKSAKDLSRRDDPRALLSRLPLLEKSDIRRGIKDLIWVGSPGGLFPQSTGGSSGEPVQFFVDRRRQACDQAARMRTHRWFGVDLGDRELFLWGSPIEQTRSDWWKRVRDRIYGHRLLNAFNMSSREMDSYWDVWDRFQPVGLYGYPSSIALWVEHALRRGRSVNKGRLRAVFVTGETCLPHQQKIIRSFFDVPVVDGYGSRDAGFISHQCPAGHRHITAEHVIVEIVRDGKPVSPGETGEIVVTHLEAYGMPFIRYRTGDRGRLMPGRCSCGRGLPLMDAVQGRTTDFLCRPDGTIQHALSVIYPLRELAGVRQFRVTQQADWSVHVELVAERTSNPIAAEAVARAVRPVLGEAVDVHVNFVEAIAPSLSGKYRYVQSFVTGASEMNEAEAIERCQADSVNPEGA